MSDQLRFGRVEILPALRQVRVDGQPVALGSRAFDVLIALAENRDRVVTKAELMELAWPGVFVEENNLSVQISSLRRVLGSHVIATVTGRGYRFTPLSSPDEPDKVARGAPAQSLELSAHQPRVAVLPFVSANDATYYGDGITEEIISALAANRSLFVIARTSTLRYRGSELGPRAIASELGVHYLVTGSVRRSDGQLRLLAELIHAPEERVIWSQRFQGAENEIFGFQSEIGSNIAGAIDPTVIEAELERVDRIPTSDLSAYDCVLRGRALQVTFTDEDFALAGDYFRRATELDPRYAQAFAHLAWWHNLRVGEGRSDSFEADREAAEELSLRGMALDPRDALVVAICAHVQGFVKRRLDVAMGLFQQALEMNPSCAFAWARSATTANFMGRGEEAQQRIRNAMRLSPFDKQAFTFLTTSGTSSLVLGDYPQAIEWYQKARRANPRYKAAWRMLVAALALAGRIEAARAEAAGFLGYDTSFRIGDFASWYPMQEPHLSKVLQGMRLAQLPE